MTKRVSNADSDLHRPPEVPCTVRCRVCQEEYQSYDLEWDGGKTAWCCPTPGCEGKGFEVDIRPTGMDEVDDEELLMGVEDFDDEEKPEDALWSIEDEDEDFDEEDDEDELEEMD